MFCRSCGKEIPTDAKFCTFCGVKVIIDPSSRMERIGANGQTDSQVSDRKKTTISSGQATERKETPQNNKGIWITVGVILLVVVVFVVGNLIHRASLKSYSDAYDTGYGSSTLQTEPPSSTPNEFTISDDAIFHALMYDGTYSSLVSGDEIRIIDEGAVNIRFTVISGDILPDGTHGETRIQKEETAEESARYRVTNSNNEIFNNADFFFDAYDYYMDEYYIPHLQIVLQDGTSIDFECN